MKAFEDNKHSKRAFFEIMKRLKANHSGRFYIGLENKKLTKKNVIMRFHYVQQPSLNGQYLETTWLSQ